MKSVCEFDDVISIVNDRHEFCRFNESVRKANKKEMERLKKERIHDMNKKIVELLRNAAYFLSGGIFAMSIALAAIDQIYLSVLISGFSALAVLLAMYFEKKGREY